jgi:hypothetical protein
LLAYPLVEPGETLRAAAGESDGAAIVGVRRENVSEAATVVLGPTWNDCCDLLHTINRLLRQAEERQEHGRGKAVYLQLDVTGQGVTNYWRSEVLAGRVSPDNATMGGYLKNRGHLQVAVRWLRRPFWEGPEMALELWSGAQSGQLLTLYNHNDGPEAPDVGHKNWFEVVGDQLLGADLASPLRLAVGVPGGAASVARLVVSGGVVGAGSAWFSQAAPGINGPFVEAELTADGSKTTAGGGLYSGDAYRSFAAPGGTMTRVASWTLPAVWGNGGEREYCRCVARLVGAAPAGARLRLEMRSAAGLLWRGPEVGIELSHELQDLGSVQLPPGALDQVGVLYADLYGAWPAGSLAVDWLAFLPTMSYRRYVPLGTGLVIDTTRTLIDDGAAGQTYLWDGVNRIPAYTVRGGALQVRPSLTMVNRFWLACEGTTGVATAGARVTVQAWTRPRRSSL